MTDILPLRERAVILASRVALAMNCVGVLSAATLEVGEDVAAWVADAPRVFPSYVDDEERDEFDEVVADAVPGRRIPLFSPRAFMVLYGSASYHSDGVSVVAHDMASALSRLRRMVPPPDATGGGVPDLSGLSTFETTMLVDGYRRAIADMALDLGEAEAVVSKVAGVRLPMPPALRSRCVDPAHAERKGTRFAYSEADFAPLPRGAKRMALLSVPFLAPALGEAAAIVVTGAFLSLRDATSPGRRT